MNTLSIDIGNSSTKVDSWADDGFIRRESASSFEDILRVAQQLNIEAMIVSTVRNDSAPLIEKLRENTEATVVEFSEEEFRKHYDFSAYKGHLGSDRAAAFLGAEFLFPQTPKLIVDAGTALTIDVADDKGNFKGGNISLGYQSRLKALAKATSRLPEVMNKENGQDCRFFGTDTIEAITFGAGNGLVGEVKYSAEMAKKEYGIKLVMLTGGDADKIRFPKNEYTTLTDPYLVGRGLDFHLRTKHLNVPVGYPQI